MNVHASAILTRRASVFDFPQSGITSELGRRGILVTSARASLLDILQQDLSGFESRFTKRPSSETLRVYHSKWHSARISLSRRHALHCAPYWSATPHSFVYELVLGFSKGASVVDQGLRYLDAATVRNKALDGDANNTVIQQLSAVRSLSGQTQVKISISKHGGRAPCGCAVLPVSAAAHVYLELNENLASPEKRAENCDVKLKAAKAEHDHMVQTKTELGAVQHNEVTEAALLAEKREKDDVARTRALEDCNNVLRSMAL
ncbi:hypothetical protein DOTSEDRAFT_82423 [Dothistroma septosporum NZE10]|uniref:Uncharacterized protein n=1 Tax=Dothistroma septosporum (strain NZE10 / CBS 128990) TaxID=675120 RepID=N1PEX4_DOTSN|nr:hypothetical protein DOTSEDRAFT_82423 [Dothistroma septosporum NZE10]